MLLRAIDDGCGKLFSLARSRVMPGLVLGTLLTGLLAWSLPSALHAEPVAVDAAGFPQIRVYLPAGEVLPPQILEDGKPVAALPLTGPAARTPLLSALVIDTSGSIAAALAQVQSAASALVSRLSNADRLALVRFSSQVEVRLTPTADRGALLRNLATLRADGATALYDAVWTGVQQAQDAPGAGLRAVVLLTDGKDEGEGPLGTPGSVLRFEVLRQRLIAAGIPVFALGLGAEVDREVLTALAAASGGRAFFADQPGEVQGLLDTVAGTLLATRGFTYISPRPTPDGTRRAIEGRTVDAGAASAGASNPGGTAAIWRRSYLAPQQSDVLWRWPVSATSGGATGSLGLRRRAVCGVGALSPAGSYALGFGPLTLLRGDGTPVGTASAMPTFRPERARVLEDSSGFLIGGNESALYSLVDTPIAGGATSSSAERVQVAADGPRNWVAVAPSGTYALRVIPQPAGPPLLEAVEAVTDTRLWVTRCPGPACDRLAGAALSDDGAALINQTGALYRISESGTVSAARPEVFYGPVSMSADGRRAAAVVWQGVPAGSRGRPGSPASAPGGKTIDGSRAVLLDDELRVMESVPVVGASADLPPVAAVSPGGEYVAVLDDARLIGLALTGRSNLEVGETPGPKPWRVLGKPAPAPAPCERTLQLDDTGRVLVSDGDSLTLLRGFAP